VVTTAPAWLSDDELATWKSFSLMHLQLMAKLASQLNADGLSLPDYLVLATLSDEPDGRRRIVELGVELGWEKSRVSHHLSRMCERGLVRKHKCPTDQRGAFVEITEFGRNELVRTAPAHVHQVRQMFIDQLRPSELRTLGAVAERVLRVLHEAHVTS
jgi:DNA-binding MarR family transcriptional regulator